MAPSRDSSGCSFESFDPSWGLPTTVATPRWLDRVLSLCRPAEIPPVGRVKAPIRIQVCASD